MPLGTMAILMLAVGVLTDLTVETLEKLNIGKLAALALLAVCVMLRAAEIEVSAEVKLNIGVIFAAGLALLSSLGRGRGLLLQTGAALAVAAVQLLLFRFLEGDALILACALSVSVAATVTEVSGALFVAAFAPVIAAALGFILDSAFVGYGVFEADKLIFDIQFMGTLAAVFVCELRRFNKKEERSLPA